MHTCYCDSVFTQWLAGKDVDAATLTPITPFAEAVRALLRETEVDLVAAFNRDNPFLGMMLERQRQQQAVYDQQRIRTERMYAYATPLYTYGVQTVHTFAGLDRATHPYWAAANPLPAGRIAIQPVLPRHGAAYDIRVDLTTGRITRSDGNTLTDADRETGQALWHRMQLQAEADAGRRQQQTR